MESSCCFKIRTEAHLIRVKKIFAIILGCQLAFSLFAAEITADDLRGTNHHAVTPVVLKAGPNEALIAKLTSRMLERQHYLHMTFSSEVASKFLDRYLDSWDAYHIYFLQSDMKEFEKYRSTLNDLTLRDGDTSPARVIFNRFRERLQQNYDYVTNLLATEKFTFDGDERFPLSRKTAPRPADMAEAKKFWRDRVRYEYLQEKLGMVQPGAISFIITNKLNQNISSNELSKLIQEKVKERTTALMKLIEEKKGQEPTAIAKAAEQKLADDNAKEIVKLVARRYQRVLHFVQEYDNDDVLQVYLTALAHCYDPHSDYMSGSELENFSIGMKLSLFGIGALLQSEDGICKIKELKPGPATDSGKLKANDKIVAVAQGPGEPVDVVDMPLKKVVELIRGPKDTEVRLTVVPADAADPSERKVVALLRKEIKLEDGEAKAKIYEIPDGTNQVLRLGMIDLPSFYSSFELEGQVGNAEPKSTTTDVAKLIKKLTQEHVAGIILDLRRNGGGSLEEAINLTALFTSGGPVVQVRDFDGNKKTYSATNHIYDGPLIVLTSRFSASASEILAGALQDYGRALIVGDSSTHGKGTVQSLMELGRLLRGQGNFNTNANPGALKITIRKFYRASGSSTQLKGVTPDMVLPSVNNELEVGESSLDNPMQWDTIEAEKYKHSDRIQQLLPELKKRSDTRIAKDHDFDFVREEIDRYKKAAADKSVSLNEAQRLKEKQENDDRAKARKKDLASRPPAAEKVYELKLKDTEAAGLPEPEKKTNTVAEAKSPSGSPITTNLVAEVEKGKTPALDSDDDVNSDANSDFDITLEEAKRILKDLAVLSSPGTTLAITAPAAKDGDKKGLGNELQK
jgi:carboxyl-terminal processing protease